MYVVWSSLDVSVCCTHLYNTNFWREFSTFVDEQHLRKTHLISDITSHQTQREEMSGWNLYENLPPPSTVGASADPAVETTVIAAAAPTTAKDTSLPGGSLYHSHFRF